VRMRQVPADHVIEARSRVAAVSVQGDNAGAVRLNVTHALHLRARS